MNPADEAEQDEMTAVETTELEGVLIITPAVHGDERGFFLESYRRDAYEAAGMPLEFVQDNHSYSMRGTLRGLHAQYRKPQGKLIRVLAGEVFDVVADARPESPTHGRHVSIELSGEDFRQLYVPPGLLHGFVVVSETAQVEYKCTDFYQPADELSVLWNDPDIGIDWPVSDPVLSDKDRDAPRLRDVQDRLLRFEG